MVCAIILSGIAITILVISPAFSLLSIVPYTIVSFVGFYLIYGNAIYVKPTLKTQLIWINIFAICGILQWFHFRAPTAPSADNNLAPLVWIPIEILFAIVAPFTLIINWCAAYTYRSKPEPGQTEQAASGKDFISGV